MALLIYIMCKKCWWGEEHGDHFVTRACDKMAINFFGMENVVWGSV